jgi:hypothetical protein
MFCRHHYRTPSVDQNMLHPKAEASERKAVANTRRKHHLLMLSAVLEDQNGVTRGHRDLKLRGRRFRPSEVLQEPRKVFPFNAVTPRK